MVRTRVGYAGGTKEAPTYRDLADHTETMEIDFDPAVITYEQLLKIFWGEHNPASEPWSTQYMAAVFYNTDEQRLQAEASAAKLPGTVRTKILPATLFTRAEDYHQKYRLRSQKELMEMLREAYPADRDFVDSTIAARLNGLLSGQGLTAELQKELETLDCPEPLRKRLSEWLARRNG